MTHEELVALQAKIDNSPGLKNLQQNLSADLMSTEERNDYGIDPFTILFIISVILQVISMCRQSRTDADVELDMANAAVLPPRKLMRLKRRLNVLWNKHCEQNGIQPGKVNPFFTAAVQAVKNCQRADISDIVQASN